MYQQFTDTPRRIATFRRPTWIHFQVVSGTLLIGDGDQELRDGRSGLSFTSADKLVSLKWENDEFWARAAAGGTSEVQVIVPK